MSSILTIVPCASITPAAALDVNTDPATAHHTCLIEPGPQDITLAGQYRVAMRAASAEATKNLRGMFPEQQDIFDRADGEPDSREELAFELFPHIGPLDFTIEDATAFLDSEFLYREALPGVERLTSTSNTAGRYTKQEALDKSALVLEGWMLRSLSTTLNTVTCCAPLSSRSTAPHNGATSVAKWPKPTAVTPTLIASTN